LQRSRCLSRLAFADSCHMRPMSVDDYPTTHLGLVETHATESICRRPLRVCHLAYTFYENDNRVIRYAEALAERGDEVDVIALRRPGQRRTDVIRGIRLSRIQRRVVTESHAVEYFVKILFFLIQSAVLLTARHLRRPYDIVHVHNVPDFLVFAALVPRLTGSRVILDIHDILPELYCGKFGAGHTSAMFRMLLMVERLSCRSAHHVIIANHLWYRTLVQRAVNRNKCTTVLNYPDLRIFRPVPPDKKRRDGKFIFMYPGTLNHHQGVDIALRAFAIAKDRMPDAEFHIYGEGPSRSTLAQLIEEMGLSGRAILRNRLPLDQICDVMASADAGIVPKRADGFGNQAFSTKIFEFMACAVPVIVSKTEIDAFYFDDSLVRFFVSGDERDLADALLDVYGRRGAKDTQVQVAREFAVQHSWQEKSAEYEALIETLVSPRLLSSSVRT
jgi:glycosyltransferase involved in cell wall biosynthesis